MSNTENNTIETVTYRNESCQGAAMRHFRENGIMIRETSLTALSADSAQLGFWTCFRQQKLEGWVIGIA